MKTVNRILVSSILLVAINGNLLKAQDDIELDKQEAWKLIKEQVLKEDFKDFNVYVSRDLIPPGQELENIRKITSPAFKSFFFFIDEKPLANWAHSCKYCFVDILTGEIKIINSDLPPDFENLEILHFIDLPSEEFIPIDFSKVNINKELLTSDPANDYAIIISGGIDKYNNWSRYWNDCSAIYQVLVDVYDYYDDHIYVLMSDGTSSGQDRRTGIYTYDSSPLDLDSDGDNDIQYSAKKSNITSVFNTLKNILDSDDHLFIFTTDHGYQESGYDVAINLWGENMLDNEFATEVNKISAGRINFVMGQCHSGGFIDDLAGTNRTIATACRYDEPSSGMGLFSYEEFLFDWIAAVGWQTPTGDPVDADINNDNWVSMREAFLYAEANDSQDEHPQYYSNPANLGCLVSLDPDIWSITGPAMICTSNSTYTLNNVPPGAVVTTWNVNSTIVSPYSGTGSSATFHATCYPIGNGTLSFTIVSLQCGSVQASKTITAGGPDYYDIELDIYYSTGQHAPNISGTWLLCPNTTYHIYLMNSSSCSTSNYIWTIPSAWTKWYQYNNMISINTNSQPGGQIMVDATTCCTGCGSVRILIDYVGQYWDCGGYYMAFPNPADGYIDIDVNKEKMTADGISIGNEYVLTMVNKMGTVKFTDEFKEFPYRINTKGIPEGLYIINLIYNGKISSIKVVIEH